MQAKYANKRGVKRKKNDLEGQKKAMAKLMEFQKTLKNAALKQEEEARRRKAEEKEEEEREREKNRKIIQEIEKSILNTPLDEPTEGEDAKEFLAHRLEFEKEAIKGRVIFFFLTKK